MSCWKDVEYVSCGCAYRTKLDMTQMVVSMCREHQAIVDSINSFFCTYPGTKLSINSPELRVQVS